MAYHFNDNVHTKSFTPQEYQVELLDAACKSNIIVSLCNRSGKSFITTKIINHIMNTSCLNGSKCTLYVSDSPSAVHKEAACIKRLTDLTVGEYTDMQLYPEENDWKKAIKEQQVLVMTTVVAVMLLEKQILVMSHINLIIFYGCHTVIKRVPCPMKKVSIRPGRINSNGNKWQQDLPSFYR